MGGSFEFQIFWFVYIYQLFWPVIIQQIRNQKTDTIGEQEDQFKLLQDWQKDLV
jgi:hypothetical protein